MESAFWFDLGIVLFLASLPIYLVWFRYRWNQSQFKGLHLLLFLFLTLIWVTVFYAALIEPQRLVVKQQKIVIGSSGSSLTLAVLSDLHLGLYRQADWLEKIVDNLNKLEPEAVVILGDLVDGERGLKHLFPLLELKTKLGTYAVLGNTDYRTGAVDVRRAVESYNVEVLTNEWVKLKENGPRLAGLDDVWYGRPDWLSALRDLTIEDSVIMAVHNPDPANRAEYHGVDLMLSGHTHGGQVRLPFVGPVVSLPIQLDQRFDQGLFSYGPMKLFITSGVGESTVRFRLFNPPEITLLEIVY